METHVALTAAEFERGYAERSDYTVAELRESGRIVRRCECDEVGCHGWQSLYWWNLPQFDSLSIPEWTQARHSPRPADIPVLP